MQKSRGMSCSIDGCMARLYCTVLFNFDGAKSGDMVTHGLVKL